MTTDTGLEYHVVCLLLLGFHWYSLHLAWRDGQAELTWLVDNTGLRHTCVCVTEV